jgi:hypothetical protein
LGGWRPYRDRLGKDRSHCQSRRSVASVEYASPPEAGLMPVVIAAPQPRRSPAFRASAQSLRAPAQGRRAPRRGGRSIDTAWRARATRAAHRSVPPVAERSLLRFGMPPPRERDRRTRALSRMSPRRRWRYESVIRSPGLERRQRRIFRDLFRRSRILTKRHSSRSLRGREVDELLIETADPGV